MFQVMAAWVLQHYQDVLGAPPKVAYIELGPGNGTLAKQILAALPMMHGGHALLSAMRLHMVEVSPGLRAMQAEALRCRNTTTAAAVCPCMWIMHVPHFLWTRTSTRELGSLFCLATELSNSRHGVSVLCRESSVLMYQGLVSNSPFQCVDRCVMLHHAFQRAG